jgi:hypothetical protein
MGCTVVAISPIVVRKISDLVVWRVRYKRRLGTKTECDLWFFVCLPMIANTCAFSPPGSPSRISIVCSTLLSLDFSRLRVRNPIHHLIPQHPIHYPSQPCARLIRELKAVPQSLPDLDVAQLLHPPLIRLVLKSVPFLLTLFDVLVELAANLLVDSPLVAA